MGVGKGKGLLLFFLALMVFPLLLRDRLLYVYVFLYLIYASAGTMWNLLAGYSGLLSLCPSAFIGIGGYTLIVGTWVGVPWPLGLVLGGLLAGVFAALISIPVFRLRGAYFTIGTFVVPEILKFVFLSWRPVGTTVYGRGAGYPIQGVEHIPQWLLHLLAVSLAFLCVGLVRKLTTSRFGYALHAIKDQEQAAERCGVDVFKVKFLAFLLSAALTGITGGLFYLNQRYIEPMSAFGMQWLVAIMLSVIIGGRGTVEGPLFGAGIYVFLYFLLAQYGELSLILQGLMLIGLALSAPRGIMGIVRSFFSRKRPALRPQGIKTLGKEVLR